MAENKRVSSRMPGVVPCGPCQVSAPPVISTPSLADTCANLSSFHCKLFFEEAPDPAQNGGIHLGRHAAGLGILLTRMINPKQSRRARRNVGFRTMRKYVESPRSNQPALLQDLKIGVPRNFSQCQDRFRLQYFQFAFEVAPAVQNFLRERLILRWRAPARRRDVGVRQV